MSNRRVVLVVGAQRSGATALAGALQSLRMHVPPPEVPADSVSPHGYAESKWVVDLHTELLERANVALDDARPSAWFETGKLCANGMLRTRVTDWLGPRFAPLPDEEVEPELVLKDPRMTWFLGLWRAVAMRCDATPAYLTTLRPVTEVVGGKDRPAARVAGWVNTMLHTEIATRGSERGFVRYDDLLTDWTIPVFRIGTELGLRSVTEASANDIRRVHQFVDPGLRTSHTWEELAVPPRLRDLAEDSWRALSQLADPDGDTEDVQGQLDELRATYVEMYEEAEGLTAATADAARRAGPADGATLGDQKGRKRLIGRSRADG